MGTNGFKVQKMFFSLFRRVSKIFSGSAFRARFPIVNKVYNTLNQKLAPESVELFGNIIYLDPGDSMNLAVDLIYEPLGTAVFFDVVKPGDVVVDIGANIGYCTLLLANLVGPKGKVIAFEPDPLSFDLLSKNVTRNGCINVELHQKAVSDEKCDLILYRDKFNNLDHRAYPPGYDCEQVEISSIELDECLKAVGAVDFIKMDVQGWEGFALKGMKKIIERSKKMYLLTEFWPQSLDDSGYGAKKFIKDLVDLGFGFHLLVQPPGAVRFISYENLLDNHLANFDSHTNLLCIKNE